jgi:hypothetical protein
VVADSVFTELEFVMRLELVFKIVIVGCVAAVGAAPRNSDDKARLNMELKKASINEAPVTGPSVPLDQLIEQTPDGAQVVELYHAVHTVRDVETANETVKAQVIKAQSIAADLVRLHAVDFKLCIGTDVPQIEGIANKARAFSAALVRVDGELTKSLAAMRQKVETEMPGSTRAKEDINRLVLATHELGRLRVQAQEIAKTVEGLVVGIHTITAPCTPTPVPPLFAERDAPPPPAAGVSAGRPPSVSLKRETRPTTPVRPSVSWQE